MQYETNMHAKLLCFLLVVVSASAATLQPLGTGSVRDASLPTLSERLTRSTSTASSPSAQAPTTVRGINRTWIADAVNNELIQNFLHNLTELANVDFSKLNQSLLTIPELPNVSTLPNIPGLREGIKIARNSVLRMLDAGVTLQSALLNTTLNAIRSTNPIESLTNLTNNILRIYYDIANSNPIYAVTTSIIQEGIRLVTSILNAVLNILSDVVKDISHIS